jgi:diacylglycerol kinase family enzyme
MGWYWWVLLVLATAFLALTLVLVYRTKVRSKFWSQGNRAAGRMPELATLTGQRVGVVVNPSKDGSSAAIAQILSACAAASLPLPKFYETTVKDPGKKQAMTALAEGADVVIVVGGDGTVRSAASGMLHTGVPMAILPLGTGNLLARNLDLPIGQIDALLAIAITGKLRNIDVGWATVTPADPLIGPPNEPAVWAPEVFTVIAGVGFDAALVNETDHGHKRRFGWMAYFISAAKQLNHQRVIARVQLDESDEIQMDARTIMIGNCGRLPGGVTLLPQAEIDDGVLDIAAVDTIGGLVGWAGLLGEVMLQGAGMQEQPHPRFGRIDFSRALHARVELDVPAYAQVDGDSLGLVKAIDTWVDKGALLVRTL